MAVSLFELWSDLSESYEAIWAEKMQQLVQEESKTKQCKLFMQRKVEILAWFITWFNKWKHFSWQFLLSLWPLCLIVFPFSLHFLYSKLFRNRCILKSLIATSTNFLLKKNWKKKTWKVLFRRQSLGSQVEILVSQTAEICHCSLYSSLHTLGLGSKYMLS